jgi:hypothetical protein
MRQMPRFILVIEGHGFQDIEDIELLSPPQDGDVVETKYGTCIVTGTEPMPDNDQFEGKITCRTP